MKPVLAIFKKDARHLWPQITVFLVLLAAGAVLDPTYTNVFASNYWILSTVLLPVACCYLIIAVIHEEKLPGDRQYWLTRPYSWRQLIGAKLLFIGVFVSLPLLIVHVTVLAAVGILPMPQLASLFLSQAYFAALIILPAAILAVLTRNLGQVILMVLIVFLPAALADMSGLFRFFGTTLFTVGEMVAVILAIGGTAILIIQYKRRNTGLSRTVLAVMGGAVVAVVYIGPGKPAIAAVTQRPPGIKVVLDPPRTPRLNYSRDMLNISLPIHFEGVPPNAKVSPAPAGIVAWLNAPEYPHMAIGAPQFSESAITLWIDQSVFLRVRDRPVNISGTMTGRLFADAGDPLPVPRSGRVTAPGVGVCVPVEDRYINIRCYSREPHTSLRIRTADNLDNWIIPRGLVQSRPSASADFQPLRRFTSQVPYRSDELTGAVMIAERPIGVLHADFEFNGVRLADYRPGFFGPPPPRPRQK